jgi:hypothetical protein
MALFFNGTGLPSASVDDLRLVPALGRLLIDVAKVKLPRILLVGPGRETSTK